MWRECTAIEANKQKKRINCLGPKILERGEFDVKSDGKVTEMLTIDIQKQCWNKKMGDMKQSHQLQLRKFL